MNIRKFFKNFFLFVFFMVLLTICPTKKVLGYGNNFIFPIARRFKINTPYSDNHRGYDYWINIGSKITATKNGTVVYSNFTFNDGDWHACDYSLAAYGNLLIVDHGETITSRYAHLSRTGNKPVIVTYFNQGDYMAIGDNNGCSTGYHLHFETRTGGTWGTPFDPYASPDWVSGVPIPVGYRNQAGTTQGPFSLSNTKIRNYWSSLEGLPRSPIGNVYSYSCQGTTGFRQIFERGTIDYCGSGNAVYHPDTITYLPDVRYRNSEGYGYNSSIVIRNNSFTAARVNITIYDETGMVFDTRMNTNLGANAIWVMKVHDIFVDYTMYDEPTFFGSAIVTSNKNVSVLVMHHMNEQSQNYTGIPTIASPSGIGISSAVYIPAFLVGYYNWFSELQVQNAGNNVTGIYAQFYTQGGSTFEPVYIGDVQPGEHAVFTDLVTGENAIGSVMIWSDSGQNLAALVVHDCPLYDMSFEYEGISFGGEISYAPTLFKDYYDWYTSVEINEVSGLGCMVYVTFNPPPNPTPTPFWLPPFGQREINTGNLAFTNGWRGSAIVNIPFAHIVTGIHHVAGNDLETLGYHGFLNGATTLYLPYVRNHPPGEDYWISSINIQNVGASGSYVYVYYYDENGNDVYVYAVYLYPAQSEELANVINQGYEMPYIFSGSVLITSSNSNIVAGVHLADTIHNNHHGYGVP